MRILIAHAAYRIAGGEDRYVDQLAELLGRVHALELVCPRNDELVPSAGSAARMTYSRRKTSDVARTIERFKPDVIHVHNIYPSLGPAVHLAARRTSTPLVMTVHNYRLRCPNGYMFTEGEVCRRCETGNHTHATLHACFPSKKQAVAYASALWLHRFPMRLQDEVSTFIAPSVFMRERLLAWGFEPERVSLVRNFTDEIPGASGAPGEGGVYLGRLSSEKGLDVLLRALGGAGDPAFTIAGGGPLEAECKALARSLRLKNLTFAGTLSRAEVVSLVKSARYLVLASVSEENSPLAVLEGLAAGRPLIVSDKGGLPELAADGRGLVVRAGDPVELAGAIGTLAGDDEMCAAMGHAGLAFAAAELRAEGHLRRLEEVYEKARARQS
jgi:glycosyltransferase involved in cell wall biosynthesis